jgi:hypothetical protein
MRHTASEGPDGFQLLGLEQLFAKAQPLFFSVFQLSHVHVEPDEPRDLTFDLPRDAITNHRKHTTILTHPLDLDATRNRPNLRESFENLFRPRKVIRRDKS